MLWVLSLAVLSHRMTHSSTGPRCTASTPLVRAESVVLLSGRPVTALSSAMWLGGRVVGGAFCASRVAVLVVCLCGERDQ